MNFSSVIFLLGLITVVVCIVWVKLKELTLIKQVTSLTRGERSERKLILKLLKEGIDPKAIFHDMYIRKPNGEYTQVDVAVATSAGIIVFEVKDYSGWIFGNEYQRHWTQLLAYSREKHRFYNPVMQNLGHIQAIRQRLPQNPDIPIYSVIVFYGNCELKNIACSADNTCIIYPCSIRQVISEISKQPDAKFGNKCEIITLFKKTVQNGNDPMIVSSQINSAAYYGRNKPRSTYSLPFSSLFRIGFFSWRRRFW